MKIGITGVVLFSVLLLATAPAYAGVLSDTAKQTEKAAYGKETTSETQISTTVGKIINAALSLLGTIFVGLLIYAGFKWMTAGGNEEEITKAKSIITQATIGLVVVIAAFLITQFVIATLAKAT